MDHISDSRRGSRAEFKKEAKEKRGKARNEKN